jgi:hypothetical protein
MSFKRKPSGKECGALKKLELYPYSIFLKCKRWLDFS